MESQLALDLQIRTQRTPNPNAWKYILNADVKRVGKVSYTDTRECEHVPLAARLLRLANVSQVHLFENVITVTQNGASDWAVLTPSVEDVIRSALPSHDADFDDKMPKRQSQSASIDPSMIEIEEILDRTIRPGLQADGGDLEVLELDGNILTVRYQGACGSCPSAMTGTLEGIESILRTEYNPYLEVVAV